MTVTSIDQIELDKFNKTTEEWWDINGEFKMLHKINPVRLEYLKSKIINHYALEYKDKLPLNGMKILDVGCGGGLISMPLAQMGAQVTGVDANKHNIDAASQYAKDNKIDIELKHTTAEKLLPKAKQSYDVVISLEVIEHVANPKEFVQNLARLIKPGGMIVLSTINRTIKSYIYAIVMAEYVLGWVPKRTHDHSKFVKPSELTKMINNTGLSLKELKGMILDLPSTKWQLSMDIDVNYFAYIG